MSKQGKEVTRPESGLIGDCIHNQCRHMLIQSKYITFNELSLIM